MSDPPTRHGAWNCLTEQNSGCQFQRSDGDGRFGDGSGAESVAAHSLDLDDAERLWQETLFYSGLCASGLRA
jgi:hypothetical protein